MLSSYDYDTSSATERDSRSIPWQTMLAFPLITTLDVSMPRVLAAWSEEQCLLSYSAAVPAVPGDFRVTVEEERETVANAELPGS